MMRFVAAVVLAAAALAGLGWLTYAAAPPGGSGWRDLIAPGLGAGAMLVAVGVLIAGRADRKLSSIGQTAALGVPIVLAVTAFWLLPGTMNQAHAYFTQTVEQAKGTFPTGHRAVGLGATAIVSTLAAIALALLRPKLPGAAPALAAGPVATTPPSAIPPAPATNPQSKPPAEALG